MSALDTGHSQPGHAVGLRAASRWDGHEGAPRAAVVIGATAWTLALASVVMLLAARPPMTGDAWFIVVDVVVAAVYGTVAPLILVRRRHVVPWVLAVTAVGGGLAAFGFAHQVLWERLDLLPVPAVAGLQSTAWVPGTLALFLVVPWLVRDHPLGPAWLGCAAGVAVTLTWFGAGFVVEGGWTVGLVTAVVAVGLLTAAEVAWRWRRGPVAERTGLGWLALGTAVMALSFLPIALPPSAGVPVWVTPLVHTACQAVFPAAILVAVLRQRLWGIDLAVSRTVVGGLLAVGLGVVYVAVTVAVARVLPGEGAAQVVAAAAVAVAVQPSRLWVQRRVQRLVHGDGVEPHVAVRRVSRELGRAASPEALLRALVDAVASSLRLESAVVRLADGRTVASGSPTRPPVVVPLDQRGSRLGALEVTARPGEALDARSRVLLDELATVVAAGVALVRTGAELDEARERLHTARLAERKAVRRELHDGLGPSLAGLRLGLQGARNLLDTDPVAAGRLLEAMRDELDQRVDDVRSLSHQLLPPVLDELGLEAALRELAARHAESGFAVDVSCDRTDGLPATVAAAAYGIAAEAVLNALRHSGARHARVVVVVDDDLVLTVADDGVGTAADARPGVGTSAMRERAQELGGTFQRHSVAGAGTQVEARLPLVWRPAWT